MTKEKFSEIENRSIEIIQFKEQRKKKWKKNSMRVCGIILNGLT